ncbi:MAG TPA: APC family permease [Mycobacteriales bacterium]|nr:APC family permease [Mycobacteriales bacterium]
MSTLTAARRGAGGGSSRAHGSGQLHRDVGLLGLTFISLGSIIGSGWLLGALTAAQTAGPASLISWVLAGFVLALLALVHAELGAAYPVSGGTARFPHYAFGSLAGYTCGWMSWVGSALLAPVEVEAALTYADGRLSFLPALTHTSASSATPTLTGWGILIATGLMVVFTAINLFGVKWLAGSNNATVVWKLAIPLLTIIALLVVAHHGSNFDAGGKFAPFGAHGVLAALPLGVVFALQGFEQALQIGGEARNPQRDLWRAVVLSMLIGTVVYLALEVAFIGSLNPSHLIHGWATPLGHVKSTAPYATIASALGLGWLASILYIDAFISPSGTALVYNGTSSRLGYALGHNRYVPPAMAAVSSRGVPWIAVIVSFVVGEAALLPFPSWASLVSVITSASALMYAFAPVSLLSLRSQDPDRDRPYRMPAANVLCPLSFISANLIIYWTGWSTLWKLYVVLGVGAVIFAANYFLSTADRRPDVSNWRSAAWIAPWLAGMAVLSKLGQFKGGDRMLPFWYDIGVVAVFSLAVFALAVRLARSPEAARRTIRRDIGDTDAVLDGG